MNLLFNAKLCIMDFEGIRNLSAWELLKLIQEATKGNTQILKENSKIIEDLLKNTYSKSNQDKIKHYQNKNNILLNQNSEYIKLHNNLLNFMKALKGETLVSKNEALKVEHYQAPESKQIVFDFDEYFSRTITGDVTFNKEHPFYDSKDFKAKLLQYYIDNEEYEKCSALIDK